VAFTPVSSLAPASVVVVGPVSVTQGTIPWDTGALTDAELRATPVDVLGPLTDAELRASAVVVDGSSVTQPVSVDSLPLPDGAATEETLAHVAHALDELLSTEAGAAQVLALLTSVVADTDATELVLADA
jgi:hypothetical protein